MIDWFDLLLMGVIGCLCLSEDVDGWGRGRWLVEVGLVFGKGDWVLVDWVMGRGGMVVDGVEE